MSLSSKYWNAKYYLARWIWHPIKKRWLLLLRFLGLKVFITGRIQGGNYNESGYWFGEPKGRDNGEPWYVTEDGQWWSAYDVRFKPDPGQEKYIEQMTEEA